ncbi:hypothetical protein BDR03DRAFT_933832 [Suillus americanus]|nr:hypothetical protein BDR03DRAFT_933832 [Suillus americanus]
MAIAIAQTYPGTTLHFPLQDRVVLHFIDYRAIPPSWKASLARVISIEMIEQVGAEYSEEYWRVLDLALKLEGGQVITIPEARLETMHRKIDLIRKWVSNSVRVLPTLILLLKSMEKGSGGCLIVDSVSNIGPHYARALREWRRRFVSRFESVIVPVLNAEHRIIVNGPRRRTEIEVFRRK